MYALAQTNHAGNNGVSFIILEDDQVIHESYSEIGSLHRVNELARGTTIQ